MASILTDRPKYSPRMIRVLPWLGMGLCLAALGGHMAMDLISRNAAKGESPVTDQKAAVTEPSHAKTANPATTVAISEPKLLAAGITTAQARYDELPTMLGVPGRIEVNADRRIDIRPCASGVIREVHAVLGQNVKRWRFARHAGQPRRGNGPAQPPRQAA